MYIYISPLCVFVKYFTIKKFNKRMEKSWYNMMS